MPVNPVKTASETTLRLKMHYRKLGLDRGWEWSRWEAFCRHFKGMTWREVAALLNVSVQELQVSKRGKRRLSLGISTYLTWVESAVLEAHGIASEPVLPFEEMQFNTPPA